jgi:hypothetical protein
MSGPRAEARSSPAPRGFLALAKVPLAIAVSLLLLLIVVAFLGLRTGRRSLERDYVERIGSLDPADYDRPMRPDARKAAEALRRVLAAERLPDDARDRLRDLGNRRPRDWSAVERQWIRELSATYRPAIEDLCRAASAGDIDLALSPAMISGRAELPDDLSKLPGISKLVRISAAEAALQGRRRAAARETDCLLGAGRALQQSPLLVYRALGEFVEREGLLSIHALLDELEEGELERLTASVRSLRSVESAEVALRTDSAYLYTHGFRQADYTYLPLDLVRSYWLACELRLAHLARGTLVDALETRRSMHTGKAPDDAFCDGFVDARVELLAKDRFMRRTRALAAAALECREHCGTVASEAWDAPEARRFFGTRVEVERLPNGDVRASAPCPSEQLGDLAQGKGLHAAMETLSQWEVRPLTAE